MSGSGAAQLSVVRARAEAFCRRYGLGRREQTLREVAPVLGVSAERVRQIEQESLAKLHAAATGSARRRGERDTRRRVTSCARA